MKKPYVWILLVVIAGLFVAGEIRERQEDTGGGSLLIVISVILIIPFVRVLVVKRMGDSKNLKIGSEILPPPKDIAAVFVDGRAITEERRRLLLRKIGKARRMTLSGKVIREVPFQIKDHWDGIWELVAYEQSDGRMGFSINRVFYEGSNADIVAECVGLKD
ncbi:MAG TPA: hypothetical protein VK968_10340 [Roseimicrobium sp.]|nr:hypothetical protein [Roseimicrobium sp.]